jgi:nicotinamidase-related amidase
MKLQKNSALVVIDMQNKYKDIVHKKEIENMRKVVESFDNKKFPIYFTQWSRCKYKHYCTRKHRKESIHNKLAYINKKKRFIDLYSLEKTKKYKCPSQKCSIIDELKSFSNKKNTFISDKMDALLIKPIISDMRKKKIKTVYIIGGWGSHCILSTAYGCVNYHNIMPYIVEDAVFDMKEYKKVVPIIIKSIIPGCSTKDIVES